MSYRPPKRSGLVAPVSQRVAVVLVTMLPGDSEIFRRTATMPEELRAEVLHTISTIKAAAMMHKQAFAECAEIGKRRTEITPAPEESEVSGSVESDPATGVLLPVGLAASRLGLSDRRVRQLCLSGDLPGAEKSGHQWLIPRTAIDQYLALKQIGQAA